MNEVRDHTMWDLHAMQAALAEEVKAQERAERRARARTESRRLAGR